MRFTVTQEVACGVADLVSLLSSKELHERLSECMQEAGIEMVDTFDPSRFIASPPGSPGSPGSPGLAPVALARSWSQVSAAGATGSVRVRSRSKALVALTTVERVDGRSRLVCEGETPDAVTREWASLLETIQVEARIAAQIARHQFRDGSTLGRAA